MNELESVTSKICSAREILACAIDAQESGNANRTETLLYAVDEYLQYYLSEFDEKFQDAWNQTVKKLKQEETLTCDENSSSPECKGAWNNFWEENYYPEEYKVPSLSGEHLQAKIQANSPYNDGFTREYYQEIVDKYEKKDKVVKWRLPVEEVKDCDTDETEYFITFPDDLLEAANLKVGDIVTWIDNGDGTYTLKHKTMSDTITPSFMF